MTDGGGESQRQRDLVVQVQRFLKYAPQGTDPEVLRREARVFDERLATIERTAMLPLVKKLRSKLHRIYQP